MKTYLASLISFFLSTLIFSQVSVGEWREHLPYNTGHKVTASATEVFMSTGNSILRYNKESEEVVRWSKVNGLSDNGVSVVKYNSTYNTLVIGYSNGNLDLMINDRVTNISDIKRFPLTGNKAINEIAFKDNLAYLSCGFGIVVLNVQKMEIKDTYYIGENATYLGVNEIIFTDDQIIAATEAGLYKADINSNNLADFNNWSRDLDLPDAEYTSIAYFKDQIYTSIYNEGYGDDSIMRLNNGVWERFNLDGVDIYDINASENRLMIAVNFKVIVYSDHDQVEMDIYTLGSSAPEPSEIIDDVDFIWFADRYRGLVKSINAWNNKIINPNSPAYEYAYCMDSEDGVVWFGNGSRDVSWNSTWNRSSGCKFENESWRSYNYNTVGVDTIWDIVDVAINPLNKDEVYMASWGKGMAHLNNGDLVERYTDYNSIIEKVQGVTYYDCRVGGLDFDNNGVLWLTNSQSIHFLKAKHNDDWYQFNMGNVAGTNKLAYKVLASKNTNLIWMVLGNAGGMAVYDYKGTIEDDTDDEYRSVTTSINGGGLPSINVLSIAEDKDGEIWVGTDKGIAVFYSPENVFSGTNSWDAQQILIQQDGYWQNLLEAEVITAIYVDGANRKWIGTASSGVYLISEDGQEEIHHFTEDNSPLLSNTIQSIAINETNGEVFIGTVKGLISYRGSATEGGTTFTDVYAFPNPVKPGYTGNIAVQGLYQDASVKITDIAGNVVYETLAEGGQANWDGNSLNGKRVSSGVYLVFCSDEEGEETMVTKILIVN